MKVLHILGNQGMGWTGGISATLNSLAQSHLAEWVEFQLVTADRATAMVSTWQPDLLVWHRASSWKGLPELLRWKTRPQILIEHHYSAGFEQHQVPSRWRFRSMLRLTYGLMDRVITISEGQRRWMEKQQLVRPEKLRLIRSSRTLDAFLQVPEKVQPETPFTLAAYGRFTEQKGFDRLIQAVQQLPSGTVQLLLGGQGPQEPILKQLAGHHPHIHFLGRVDDVPGFLNRCDAVVIPSRWEPWGNVCLEARAAARPVLVTDIDGLSEQAEGCGLRVEPDRETDLAAGIQTLVNAFVEQRQIWGQQGRLTASRAWEDYVNAWDKVLRELQ